VHSPSEQGLGGPARPRLSRPSHVAAPPFNGSRPRPRPSSKGVATRAGRWGPALRMEGTLDVRRNAWLETEDAVRRHGAGGGNRHPARGLRRTRSHSATAHGRPWRSRKTRRRRGLFVGGHGYRWSGRSPDARSLGAMANGRAGRRGPGDVRWPRCLDEVQPAFCGRGTAVLLRAPAGLDPGRAFDRRAQAHSGRGPAPREADVDRCGGVAGRSRPSHSIMTKERSTMGLPHMSRLRGAWLKRFRRRISHAGRAVCRVDRRVLRAHVGAHPPV